MKTKLALTAFIIILLSFNIVSAQNKSKQAINSRLREMKKYNGELYCPTLAFIDTSGKKVTLDQYKGKNTLINLWFIGCMPCFSEIPFEKAMHDRFSTDTTLTLLNICVIPAGFERWRSFIENYEMAGTHLMMDEHTIDSMGSQKTGQILRARSFPTYILLDKDMKIAGYEMPAPSDEIQLDYILYHLSSGRTSWDLYKELATNLEHFDGKNDNSAFNQWIRQFYKKEPIEYFMQQSN